MFYVLPNVCIKYFNALWKITIYLEQQHTHINASIQPRSKKIRWKILNVTSSSINHLNFLGANIFRCSQYVVTSRQGRQGDQMNKNIQIQQRTNKKKIERKRKIMNRSGFCLFTHFSKFLYCLSSLIETIETIETNKRNNRNQLTDHRASEIRVPEEYFSFAFEIYTR